MPPIPTLLPFPHRALSTTLIYQPRSRPPTPPPPALHPVTFTPRLDSRPDWQGFTTVIKAKRPFKGAPPDLEDLESKLYLPTTRIFPTTQSIPFYLSFLSSPNTLAAFMPFGPQTPGSAGSSVGGHQCTWMRLTRQVIVDANNPNLRAQTALVVQRELGREGVSSLSGPISSSSEVWDMTTIGEGSFKLFVSWPRSQASKERPFSRDRSSFSIHGNDFPPSDDLGCFFSTFVRCYGRDILWICTGLLFLVQWSCGLRGVYHITRRAFAVRRLESRTGLDNFLW